MVSRTGCDPQDSGSTGGWTVSDVSGSTTCPRDAIIFRCCSSQSLHRALEHCWQYEVAVLSFSCCSWQLVWGEIDLPTLCRALRDANGCRASVSGCIENVSAQSGQFTWFLLTLSIHSGVEQSANGCKHGRQYRSWTGIPQATHFHTLTGSSNDCELRLAIGDNIGLVGVTLAPVHKLKFSAILARLRQLFHGRTRCTVDWRSYKGQTTIASCWRVRKLDIDHTRFSNVASIKHDRNWNSKHA